MTAYTETKVWFQFMKSDFDCVEKLLKHKLLEDISANILIINTQSRQVRQTYISGSVHLQVNWNPRHRSKFLKIYSPFPKVQGSKTEYCFRGESKFLPVSQGKRYSTPETDVSVTHPNINPAHLPAERLFH